MLFIITTLLTLTSCSILDRIRGSEFSILYEGIVKTGLTEVLSRPGPLTLFAPTNQAFISLGINLNTIKLEELRHVLLYHILGRSISLPKDIQIQFPAFTYAVNGGDFPIIGGSVSSGLSFQTLNGQRIRITGDEYRDGPGVAGLPTTYILGYRVHDQASNSLRLTDTYQESNGVVFRIEHVMNPDRTYNIVDTKGQGYMKGRDFGPPNNGFGPPQNYGYKRNINQQQIPPKGSTNVGMPKGNINQFREMNQQKFNQFRSNYGGYQGSQYSKTTN